MCGRIIRIIRIIIVKKKRRIAIHHPTTVGVTYGKSNVIAFVVGFCF
jgi:hypothetical protein